MRKPISISLAVATLLGIATTAAKADVVIIRRPVMLPTFVRTQQLLMPTTIRRTVTTMPAVIQTVPATTTVTPLSVPIGTTSTTTTVTETKVQTPDFVSRLHNMMDQITLGETNGSLTADESTTLRAEYNRLDSLIQADLIGGLTTDEINDLEKQLTVFNQQISGMMQ